MEWFSLMTKERLGKSDNEPEDSRSEFDRDCDSIIFTSSFRRLGKKTQVHPLVKNDHIHTRLSHSLEVACVGRSLGYLIGENVLKNNSYLSDTNFSPSDFGSVVKAACLAHDIGNPPFGHAGEDAIRNWFRLNRDTALKELVNEEKDDFLFWEGNAQGFRILTKIEHDLFEYGMKLTYSVLGAMLKYPWTSETRNEKGKYGCFRSEKEILSKVCSRLGLKKNLGVNFNWSRHPLAFLSEAADDICYRVLDLEDAHEMNLIGFDKVSAIFEKSGLFKNDKYLGKKNLSHRRKVSYMRGRFINSSIHMIADVYKKNQEKIMSGEFEGALLNKLADPWLSIYKEIDELYSEKIFNEKRKVEIEIGSYSIIAVLLDNFCRAVNEITQGKRISFKTERIGKLLGEGTITRDMTAYEGYLRIMDYIAGMTDTYATYIAKQFMGYGQ